MTDKTTPERKDISVPITAPKPAGGGRVLLVEMAAIWNIGLTAGGGFLVWWIKSHHEEVKRVTILLNRTREEVRLKNTSLRLTLIKCLGQIMSKFDKIEEKLDRLVDEKKNDTFLYSNTLLYCRSCYR